MQSSFSLARVWFVLSLMALMFVYGVGVGTFEWFPHSFLDRALAQARVMLDAELDSKPKAFDRQGTQTYRPREMASRMTVVTSWWQTDDGTEVGMKLIDREGKVLHE